MSWSQHRTAVDAGPMFYTNSDSTIGTEARGSGMYVQKSPRFSRPETDSPGPGAYVAPRAKVGHNGSKARSTFGARPKERTPDHHFTPGPGMYCFPNMCQSSRPRYEWSAPRYDSPTVKAPSRRHTPARSQSAPRARSKSVGLTSSFGSSQRFSRNVCENLPTV